MKKEKPAGSTNGPKGGRRKDVVFQVKLPAKIMPILPDLLSAQIFFKINQ
jgi:hypothetical protein